MSWAVLSLYMGSSSLFPCFSLLGNREGETTLPGEKVRDVAAFLDRLIV